MIRRIITIDEEKCNGCGLCASACHEGAIEIVDGKAKLVQESYCDGLGDCLPSCPQGAIAFVEREAAAYDEVAVAAHLERRGATTPDAQPDNGCDQRREHPSPLAGTSTPSCLGNWPVQIKLAPVQAPYFDGADLLVSADCCAFSYGSFHEDFIRDRVCLVGCPKLDGVDYAGKLVELFAGNDIARVTIARMEVPCCGGLENMTKRALQESGKSIDCRVVTIGLDGTIRG